MELMVMTEKASRNTGLTITEVLQGLTTLRDLGWLEKLDTGWSVSMDCPCSQKSIRGESPFAARGDCDPNIVAQRRSEARRGPRSEAEGIEVEAFGVMEESARGPKRTTKNNPRLTLARDFFPQLCRDHRIPIPGYSWVPLARHLRLWQENYGITNVQAQEMMEEFVKHPQWCLRSSSVAWRVFVGHREQLLSIIATRQRRDPSRYGREQGAGFWLSGGRHTPRSYSVP